MRKVLLIIGLMIVMVGCNNPLRKSISEELTMEEIKSISKRDPLFLAVYDTYFENKCYEGFLKDKTVLVLYSDLTYKKFYEYVQQTTNEDFVSSAYEDAEKEWSVKYGCSERKFDSIINHWEKHVAENTIETYLDIEFDHASPYKNYYNKGLTLYFKIIPKKEKLRDVRFDYNIWTKEDEPKVVISESADHIYRFSQLSKKGDYYEINSIYLVYSKNSFYDDLVENKLSSEELRNKYNFKFDIHYIKTDGDSRIAKVSEYQDVPVLIRLFIKEPTLSQKELIIRKYFDKDYILLDDYKEEYLKSKREEKDAMCYNFFQYIVDCKKAL